MINKRRKEKKKKLYKCIRSSGDRKERERERQQ
jgi:hypothetical protein